MRSTLDAPPAPPDPLLPGMGLVMVSRDLREEELARSRPGPPRRGPRPQRRWRRLAWAPVLVLLLASAGVGGAGFVDARREAVRSAEQVAALRAELAATIGALRAAETEQAELMARLRDLRARIDELRAAKVKVVTETVTEIVTETVYVPNGEEVSVEVTGFEGMIRIYDTQLTHSYGYSDLIGIAENTSGRTIAYAQLGCSFLDRSGRLLAAGMDNKQDWRPGQTWGFVCSAEVDATGAILRVDELS